jgi:hypothetical protein
MPTDVRAGDAIAGTSAVEWTGATVTSRLLSLTVGRAAAPCLRTSVPGVSGVARVAAGLVEEIFVEIEVAAASDGFGGRRRGLGASFVAVNCLFADGVWDDADREWPGGLDCDDSPGDEPLPESPGAADATAAVFATASPTPSATARAHMQPMCFAFSMGGVPSLTLLVAIPLYGSRRTPADGSNLDDSGESQQLRRTRGRHKASPDIA